MANRQTRSDAERRRATAEQARLAELITADPFPDVPLARPRKPSEAELKAMGEACAAEYARLYGKG